MTDSPRRADILFVESELRHLLMPVESLEALCRRSVQTFMPCRNDAAPLIAALLKDSLIKQIPTSLVRVGDGEGNALALTREDVRPIYLDSFNAKFFSQVGMTLREDEARMLCGKIRNAISAADFIGFRSFDAARPEIETISNALENGQIGAAVGILYAQAFLQDELLGGRFSDKLITSMWIHLALIPHIGDIMEAAPAVIVITGRAQLEPHFEARLGKRLRSFIAVPPQSYRPSSDEDTHYRRVFPRVLDALRADLQGTLVIVGAGFLGKLYCEAAKNSGAVALDFGSAFDVLAGMSTRPVHARLDINALRWM